MHAIARVVLLLLAAAACTHASAQEIVIGHVCGYTGPARNDANEMGAGAQALIEAVAKQRQAAGIPVPDGTWELIAKTAKELNVGLPA